MLCICGSESTCVYLILILTLLILGMPRIISADSEWKSVAFPGDIVSDRNFLFLSSFEEMNFGGSEKFVESNDSNQKQVNFFLNYMLKGCG